MSERPTPETDAYITSQNFYPTEHQWRCFARKLERELNEARRERDAAREELSRVRKELVASNRGAETNSKVSRGLCSKLAEAERERDEAMKELSVLKAKMKEEA